jgi:hypothetical protein
MWMCGSLDFELRAFAAIANGISANAVLYTMNAVIHFGIAFFAGSGS